MNPEHSYAQSSLAWLVYPLGGPDDEQRTAIVFEHESAVARSKGAQELGLDIEEVDVERAPALDAYRSHKHVPIKVLIREGWRVDCAGCGSPIASRAFDEESQTDLADVIEDQGRVFCHSECKRYLDLAIERQREKFDAFKQRVISQRPDLTFTDFQGLWPQVTLIAQFTFPGARFGGTVRDQLGNGNLVWSVSNGDLPAWEAYTRDRNRGGFDSN